MRVRVLIVGAALFAVSLCGGLYASGAASDEEVKTEQVLQAPLAGEPGKEVDIKVYTFAPGASVPWHIHPDAHEFDYELGGTLTLEIEGQPPRELKPGEAVYVPPNVVHRGLNRSTTEPAKVYVVRVKPKDKPLTEDVQH
jgi:quercetin dioxygenase-like cupin family protein